VKEDSFFHLRSPDNAVTTPTVTILLECGTPSVLVKIEGSMRRLILDTGSNVSILQPGVSRSDVRVTNLKPYGAHSLRICYRPSRVHDKSKTND